MCVKDSAEEDFGGRVPRSSSRAPALAAPMASAAEVVDDAYPSNSEWPATEGKENSPSSAEGGGWEDVDDGGKGADDDGFVVVNAPAA